MRKVQPYCYGISEANNRVLRGYQISGHSTSGKPQGWKLFKESKISKLKTLNKRFSINSKYNPNDSHMTRIICNI